MNIIANIPRQMEQGAHIESINLLGRHRLSTMQDKTFDDVNDTELYDGAIDENVYLMENIRDEEGPEEESKGQERHSKRRRLEHWTKSPDEESKYSDWKLTVRQQSEDENLDSGEIANINFTATYSIHRTILGPQSEYFERVFLGNFSESNQHHITITLPGPTVAIRHFETTLEYCYTGKINLNADNAVAIVYLSDYLGIEELKDQAQSFIRKSIREVRDENKADSDKDKKKSETLAIFYRNAKSLAIENVQKAIIHICGGRPEIMSKDSALAKIPDIEFWCSVWIARTAYPNQIQSTSKLWSENVAHFVDNHPGLFCDYEHFCRLTDIDSLPIISTEAAILLMEQEQRLVLHSSRQSENGDNANIKRGDITCLQKRCTECLYDSNAGVWLICNPRQFLQRSTQNLPRVVLESILLRTIEYRRPPVSITISEANDTCTNGVYRYSGIHGNAFKFERRGTFRDKSRLFRICKCTHEYDDSTYWSISVSRGNDDPTSDEGLELNTTSAISRDEEHRPELPNETSWEYALTCSFNFVEGRGCFMTTTPA